MYSQKELEYIGYLLVMQNMQMATGNNSEEEQPRIAYIYHNGSEAGIECLDEREENKNQ